MTPAVTVFAVIAIGYVLGSIPIANTVARAHGIADLREVGDHNPGYWNARGLLGARTALPIFFGDVAKGSVAALIGVWASDTGQWWMPYIGGAAAMVGHAWPIFARFDGGRSVLTFVGSALVFAPEAAALAVLLTVAIWVATRRFEWAARAGVVAFPIIQLVVDGPRQTAATGILMTLIGIRFALARDSADRAIRGRDEQH